MIVRTILAAQRLLTLFARNQTRMVQRLRTTVQLRARDSVRTLHLLSTNRTIQLARIHRAAGCVHPTCVLIIGIIVVRQFREMARVVRFQHCELGGELPQEGRFRSSSANLFLASSENAASDETRSALHACGNGGQRC